MACLQMLKKTNANDIFSAYRFSSLAMVTQALVLNALEAGACKIMVRFDKTRSALQVDDDGQGVDALDFPFLGQAGSTSKEVHTGRNPPGFSLAALSTVSQEMIFVSACAKSGYKSVYEKRWQNGKVTSCRSSQRQRQAGSSVTVIGLFHSLPVRQQALYDELALSSVVSMLQTLSIVHVETKFQFCDAESNSQLLELSSADSSISRIASVFDPTWLTCLSTASQTSSCGRFSCRLVTSVAHKATPINLFFFEGVPVNSPLFNEVRKQINKELRKQLQERREERQIFIRDVSLLIVVELSCDPSLVHVHPDGDHVAIAFAESDTVLGIVLSAALFDMANQIGRFLNTAGCRCTKTKSRWKFRGAPKPQQTISGTPEQSGHRVPSSCGSVSLAQYSRGSVCVDRLRQRIQGSAVDFPLVSDFQSRVWSIATPSRAGDSSSHSSPDKLYSPDVDAVLDFRACITHSRQSGQIKNMLQEKSLFPTPPELPTERMKPECPTNNFNMVDFQNHQSSKQFSRKLLNPTARRRLMTGATRETSDSKASVPANSSPAQSRVPSSYFSGYPMPGPPSTSVSFTRGETPPRNIPQLLPVAQMALHRNDLHNIRIVGQLDTKFIVCVADLVFEQEPRAASSTRRVCIVIDQHAADERVRLEKYEYDLRHQAQQGKRSGICRIVKLRQPSICNISQEEIMLLDYYERHANFWGFRWNVLHRAKVARTENSKDSAQSFTTPTIQLSHVPCLLGERLDMRDLTQFLHQLQSRSAPPQAVSSNLRPAAIKRILDSKACRNSIMFGDILGMAEMRQLLTNLQECNFPFQCAHGRPSVSPVCVLPN